MTSTKNLRAMLFKEREGAIEKYGVAVYNVQKISKKDAENVVLNGESSDLVLKMSKVQWDNIFA